jgi:hypothetical protein
MVLRVPEVVDDRRLLNDEPFKTIFKNTNEGGDNGGGRHRRGTRPPLYVTVERAMRGEASGVRDSQLYVYLQLTPLVRCSVCMAVHRLWYEGRREY